MAPAANRPKRKAEKLNYKFEVLTPSDGSDSVNNDDGSHNNSIPELTQPSQFPLSQSQISQASSPTQPSQSQRSKTSSPTQPSQSQSSKKLSPTQPSQSQNGKPSSKPSSPTQPSQSLDSKARLPTQQKPAAKRPSQKTATVTPIQPNLKKAPLQFPTSQSQNNTQQLSPSHEAPAAKVIRTQPLFQNQPTSSVAKKQPPPASNLQKTALDLQESKSFQYIPKQKPPYDHSAAKKEANDEPNAHKTINPIGPTHRFHSQIVNQEVKRNTSCCCVCYVVGLISKDILTFFVRNGGQPGFTIPLSQRFQQMGEGEKRKYHYDSEFWMRDRKAGRRERFKIPIKNRPEKNIFQTLYLYTPSEDKQIITAEKREAHARTHVLVYNSPKVQEMLRNNIPAGRTNTKARFGADLTEESLTKRAYMSDYGVLSDVCTYITTIAYPKMTAAELATTQTGASIIRMYFRTQEERLEARDYFQKLQESQENPFGGQPFGNGDPNAPQDASDNEDILSIHDSP